MNEALKGLYQHCEGSMLDRCGECPYHEPDYNNPCAGIDCRDRLIIALYELVKDYKLLKYVPDKNGWREGAHIKEPCCLICSNQTCKNWHDNKQPEECRSYMRSNLK